MFYADEYKPDFGYPFPTWTPEELDQKTEAELKNLYSLKTQIEANAKVEPVTWGWTLPGWQQVMDEWANYTNHIILGGNRCLRGDTPLYDPVRKATLTIEQWALAALPMHVQSVTTAGIQSVPVQAPFLKGRGPLVEARFSDTSVIRCAPGHKLLTPLGWLPLSSMQKGQLVASSHIAPSTKTGSAQPSSRPCARHSSETSSDCPGGCSGGSGPGDEPLHPGATACPASAPSQAYALERSHSDSHEGGRALSQDDTRPCLCSRRHSSAGDPCPPYPETGRSGPSAGSGRSVSESGTFSEASLSEPRTRLVAGQSRIEIDPSQCRGDGVHHDPGALIEGSYGCFSWVVLDSKTDIEPDRYYDITVPEWGNYIAAGIVHANSSKSTCASRLIVDAALRIPEARIRCFSTNEERSIAEQQALIWEALPNRLKALSKHKGRAYSLGYNQRNGFTGGKIVMPAQPGYTRGSEIIFTNYQSYKNDAQTAEGWWAHLVWGDEEMPQKLFETLQYRLVDARGRLVLTFTTLNGWSPLIADVMGRTKVLSKRHAPLLNREIPDAMESLSRSRTRLYFFWTEDQRFIPVDDFVESLKGRPADEIMARAYGIPTKSSQSPFPTFDETVHVVPHETLPFVLDPHYKVTRYHVVDPSGSKPWFMIWAAVDEACCYIYREWPDIAYGEWAEAGEGPEGKAGPAQRPLAWGIRDYVDHIQQCEIGENVFERIIDPRLGAAPVQGKEGATSIITELDDMGLTMIPSPGLQIDHGLMLINSALKFDQSKPISATNRPKLVISDRCQNTIFALKNFTNQGGKDEATKDPIDCLRYLLMTGADYVDQQEAKRARTWSY